MILLKNQILNLMTITLELLGLLALLTVIGCGHERKHHEHEEQKNCTTTQTEEGATISCPDGTVAQIKNGSQGPQGIEGDDGYGRTGPQGPQGYPGFSIPGPQGEPGQDGIDGINGTTVTQVLPCPSNTAAFPELLLCIGNRLYAVYDSNPTQVHLTEVVPGNYVTTDGRSCHFTVVSGCTIQ